MGSRIAILLYFLLVLTTWAVPTSSQNNLLSWQVVGQIGGPTQGVAVQGSYAYVGVGLRLVVLDVSNPFSLQEVGATTPFPYFVEDVAVSGNLAYVAAGGAGLRIVDVSNPSHPTEIGAWDSRGYAEGVAVAGNVAFLADGPYGLRLVDVSNPAQPNEIGFAFEMNYAFKVAVDGQYAYIAAAGAGLLIADVSDPRHPVEVGTYDTPGYAYGVAVSGNTVYIADGWEGLKIVDVTDPKHPVQIGSYKTPGWAFGVTVSGTLAYVADAFKGLRVVDVSDPAHPAEVGAYEPRGDFRSAVVAGPLIYIADRSWGLRIVNGSNPAQPVQLNSYGFMGDAREVAVMGTYAYVASGYYGLRVVDMSDPAHPKEVGSYPTQSYALSVEVVGNYAYVATGPQSSDRGLHIVDITDPAQPNLVGFYPISPHQSETGGAVHGMTVRGGIAYIANEHGLLMIDVTNPFAPTWQSSIYLSGVRAATVAVAIGGTMAYVAQRDSGFSIVDIANPNSPGLVGIFQTPGPAEGIAVSEGKAYVAAGWAGLRIVDVSDPAQLRELGSYDTPGWAFGVAESGTLAYIADGNAGIQIVDVSDPFTPTLVASHNTSGFAYNTRVVGNSTYVADGEGGLIILEAVPNSVTASGKPGPRREITEEAGKKFRPYRARAQVLTNPERPQVLQRNEVKDKETSRTPDNLSLPRTASTAKPTSVILSTAASSGTGGTCTVTSPMDSGPGTLRRCLEETTTGRTITFDPSAFPPTTPVTIPLSSPLPFIAQSNITIDASDAGVILDGGWHGDNSGLVITSDGNTIKGLQIMRFPETGIVIRDGARNNIIGGNRMQGHGPSGEGNVISDNGRSNVSIEGRGTMNNAVIGNHIGTDATGFVALSGGWGVRLAGGAQYNRIGGTGPGERNVISGYSGHRIGLYDTGTMFNTIIGNYIGTDASGKALLGKGAFCIHIADGASYNRIGGTNPGEGNLISGCNELGIEVGGAESSGNAIIGNYIGTDVSGAVILGIFGSGISIEQGAINNLVKGNLVSGCSRHGIAICDSGSSFNVVIGNLIGTDASGGIALGNGEAGVITAGDVSFNRIGGTAPEERNIICGNNSDISLQAGVGNLVLGNSIGTDVNGTKRIQNQGGVTFGESARRSFIGGTTEAERNLINGSNGGGIPALGALSGTKYNFIAGNSIGTDARGMIALGNQNGIDVDGEHNIIQGNTIAYGSGSGVSVTHSSYNTIRRNGIYSNGGKGIVLSNNGNNMLSAPVITAVNSTAVSGTACPRCILEIFSDAEDEGRVYEGSTIADASGAFIFSKGSYLTGPNVTATATDLSGNTSEFSTPITVNVFPNVPSSYWADFDGDGATDVAAFHLPTNQFFTDYSGNLGQFGWGGSDSMPLIWDYDGDGKTDVSIYHIPTNQWFVNGVGNLGQYGWGGDDSVPVPGDYNGDGRMERAFYHSPTNQWFVEGQDPVTFGWGGADCIPLPGDYDGDGKTDMVIYHLPSNQWFQYGVGDLGQFGWGGADCIPVPGDYNGDGKTEIAVYHIPTNQWFVKGIGNLGQYGWGGLESFPIPGDYDGDGVMERGFYRPSENRWFIEGESDFVWGWGGSDFMPITSQIAVYNWFRFTLHKFE
jgi:parallel beta-helix repeat protein